MTRIFKNRRKKEPKDVSAPKPARGPILEGRVPHDSFMRDAHDRPPSDAKTTDCGSFDERQRLLFC